jgi:hypothetical protein
VFGGILVLEVEKLLGSHIEAPPPQFTLLLLTFQKAAQRKEKQE